MSDNCLICQTVLNRKTPTQNSAFSTYAYDCPRCGKFVFKFRERDLEWTLNHSDNNDERFILSYNIRKMQKDDSEAVLDGDLIKAILKRPLPKPSEQKDIFVRWVGDNIKTGGDYVKVNKYSIPAIIGARTEKEFYFIFEHLKTKGIVKNKTVVGGGDSALMEVTLSFEGLEYYEELKGGDTDSRKVESVSKEQVDEIHDNTVRTIMEWDVFISHASEDKKEFVRPLAKALTKAGLKVWYDEMTLKLGDSLRRSIDRGLTCSRYGVVVISHHFLKKDWPQKELDGLTSLEIKGRKVILPIWHNISRDEVLDYSPLLADRLAANSSDGLGKVVNDILEAI